MVDTEKSKEEEAERLIRNHQAMIKYHCEDSPETTGRGHDVAAALFKAYRQVDAERLLNKILTTSRQVHGADHFR